MMPFLRREDIDPALRQKFESSHKAKLRNALLDPGLTENQRRGIKEQLDQIGKPKAYTADTPLKPGAISFDGHSARRRKARKRG